MSDDDLAGALAAAVLAVPGVLQTYDARPVVVAVVADAAAAVRSSLAAGLPVVSPSPLAPSSPIVVSRDGAAAGGALRVGVRIAVSEERPAAATCRDVYAAIADVLAAVPGAGEVAEVSVQISRIG